MASTENQDPPVVLAGLMKRLNVGPKMPSPANGYEPSVLPVKQGAGDRATRLLSATTLRLLEQTSLAPPQPEKNGKPMSKFDLEWLVPASFLAAAVFVTVYPQSPGNVALQTAGIERSKQESLSRDQVDLAIQKTKQAEMSLKIAKVTGMAPQGFISPSVQAHQRAMQQPVQSTPQQPGVQGVRGKIVLPLNKSFIASADFTYEIDGNEPGTFAVVMYAPYELKRIQGEYMFVYHRGQSSEKTEWVKGNGSIPEEVKKFLEAHKQVPGSDYPIAIYTRGRVIINT